MHARITGNFDAIVPDQRNCRPSGQCFPSAIASTLYNAGPNYLSTETGMRILAVLLFAILTIPFVMAQQNQTTTATPDSAKPAVSKKDKSKKEPASSSVATPDKPVESSKPAETPKSE